MTPFDVHDPLLLLLAALALDAAFGDMPAIFRHVPHPVKLAGAAIAFFDQKLNRPNRGDRARRARGIITVALLVGVAVLCGGAIQAVCRLDPVGSVAEALVIAILLAQRGLYDHVAAVGGALVAGGLQAGRLAVGHIVGRDPASLDAHGVARAAIESLAENFSDGVVAPACWYLVLGLPGLFAYKMINTLDSMIGHRSPRYREFGWAAARLDDLANLLPARLSGALLAAAAGFAAQARPGQAWRIMLRDGRRHRSPNAGWPEAAMAGALDLALAGPRQYAEGRVEDAWMGDGTPAATAADIARALRLYAMAGRLAAGLLVGVWLAAHLTRLG